MYIIYMCVYINVYIYIHIYIYIRRGFRGDGCIVLGGYQKDSEDTQPLLALGELISIYTPLLCVCVCVITTHVCGQNCMCACE